ncbi:diguanylate cyclase (GGDEF) domain-containing protein [Pseudobutyrivibrio sp. YE44]|uniref:two-component system response regulator n=1 Tax=Pseudobutyrivibrio sp. YE44 TaxID=1520802 RepID=UPI0008861CE8|nr:EAL domain-containing response regulator [Pseudobutyrivibrio sp. YE44]SDB14085.1 diguanylate cyclase (GGDEF) domain-containing protein [Pseudobutyrivibrio sp. YE44]
MKEFVENKLKLKRKVLVVDDGAVERKLLKDMLEEHYEVLLAEDGKQALQIIKDNYNTLSLILLDLIMPEMDGYEVLSIIGKDETMCRIPVIVLTADDSAEVKSLRMGAADFIQKPYNVPEVIFARIDRIIQLYENNTLVSATKDDPLTGLLTKEYFINYVEMIDHYAPEKDFDIIVLDVNKFHLINEIHGHVYGNRILKELGVCIQKYVDNKGGVACRSNGDTFILCVPHQSNPNELLWEIHVHLKDHLKDVSTRIRMGVYSHSDRHVDVEKRVDWALLACNSIKGNYGASIAYYDAIMHEREAYDEKLLHDLESALEEDQFIVFYQPKYFIQEDRPRLISAEALIRWKHPELGMINPSLFIPVLEQNGLIQKLDKYIWKTAAEQVAAWREKFGRSVPVSVNVSRIDLLEPNFVENITHIVREAGLTPNDYILEVTESVYTDNSDGIIDIVKQLRSLGFRIEMDDFGSGYSSLNMISSLPFDTLKLDIGFVRHIHENPKDYKMVEIILQIARLLNVKVVAEGVEYEEQHELLKKAGVDIIQGYYYSKPVDAETFEIFIKTS